MTSFEVDIVNLVVLRVVLIFVSFYHYVKATYQCGKPVKCLKLPHT